MEVDGDLRNATAEAHGNGRPRRLVEIAGVSKRYGSGPDAVAALDNVTLSLEAGEFFALLGPSGCGKTTLLRLLAGFAHPDAGDLRIGGRSALSDPPNKRPVNIVFQSFALFPHLSVADNVGFGLRNLGLRGTALRARVEAALRLVRLESMAGRKPAALSGGQQQRVALARALAPRPRLLLLDEPLSALDPQLRRGMQAELKRIQRETGITFLLVTHDREEALSLADRLAVMEGGRVRQIGTPTDIFERPRSRFVASFTGANVLPGALVGLAAPFAAIRPERVAVGGSPDGAALRARVDAVTYLGARTACALTLDDGTCIDAERDDLPPGLVAGDLVGCRLPREALVPLDDPA